MDFAEQLMTQAYLQGQAEQAKVMVAHLREEIRRRDDRIARLGHQLAHLGGRIHRQRRALKQANEIIDGMRDDRR